MTIPKIALDSDLSILLEWTHKCFLLFDRLEATVTHLGGRIDKLELDRLQSRSGCLLEQGFSECDGSLLWATYTTLDHDKVALDQTIVNKSTNGVDRFISDIDDSGGVVSDLFAVDGVVTGTNTVHLLVNLSSVMVTLLTGSSNGEGNTRWMPCSNTGNLSETLVSLSWQFLCMPSRSDTVVTATLGDT